MIEPNDDLVNLRELEAVDLLREAGFPAEGRALVVKLATRLNYDPVVYAQAILDMPVVPR